MDCSERLFSFGHSPHMLIKRSGVVRFSEIQKKEVIDGAKGSFLGYVQDATVNVKTGIIETLHVSGGERGLFFDTKKNELRQIRIRDITVIGKDIILVNEKVEEE